MQRHSKILFYEAFAAVDIGPRAAPKSGRKPLTVRGLQAAARETVASGSAELLAEGAAGGSPTKEGFMLVYIKI